MAYVVRAPDGSVHIGGEVLECDPPRKLTVTFNVNWPALIEKLGPTLVTYEIEPAGDAVRLTMTESHDRPISDDILSGGRQGWPAILSSLKSLLETGEALVDQDGAAKADAGSAEEVGYCDAVSIALSIPSVSSRRTPGPIAVARCWKRTRTTTTSCNHCRR